jgi:hypothetical protein
MPSERIKSEIHVKDASHALKGKFKGDVCKRCVSALFRESFITNILPAGFLTCSIFERPSLFRWKKWTVGNVQRLFAELTAAGLFRIFT